MHGFGALSALISCTIFVCRRLEYPELKRDPDSIGASPPSSISSSTSSNQPSVTALIDSDPLGIPLCSMLTCLGHGVYNSYSYLHLGIYTQSEGLYSLYEEDSLRGGIPWRIWRNQWEKLTEVSKKSFKIGSEYRIEEDRVIQRMLACIETCMNAPGGVGLWYKGLDCIALPNESSSQGESVGFIRKCNNALHFGVF